MSRNVSSFVKGMGAGMAAAAVIVTAGKMCMDNSKSLRKKVNKAAQTISDIADNVQYFMK